MGAEPLSHVVIEPRPWRAPAEVLSAFADEPGGCAFLSGGDGDRSRWSYLMRRPDRVLRIGRKDAADPFRALAGLLGERQPHHPDGPPFQGGVAGLAGYELGDRVEPLGLNGHRDGWPDLAVGRYPALLAFDHRRRQALALGRGRTPAEAGRRADEAAGWLSAPGRGGRMGRLTADFTAVTAAEDYQAAVAEVVARIHAGEIFQANIARLWRGGMTADAGPFDLLARLIADSPAPFAGWLHLGDLALVSNSPERFVTVEAGEFRIETRPIKGTRPRGADAASDRALAAELLASEKDRAENLMIVDLMRNDLARVSPPGSVTTPELFAIESFANVHHLVSTVTARLAPGRSAIDLLGAAFPPGSVTGAPKVQAMKVIAGLEPPRGPYCGSLFWAGVDGGFDSSVLIRTAAFARAGDGWRVEARAGAGIVADSDPLAERLETEAKIAALSRALTLPLAEAAA
ncbi:MAG: anthranilate synthase component I family protein [Caulobacter sp.]|nr:anthranilate synthase component I family protein [Caulobacter sp.]